MAIDGALFFNLAKAATSKEVSVQGRAIITSRLDQLKTWLQQRVPLTNDEEWKAFYGYIASMIGRFEENPGEFKVESPLDPPPGMPIGMEDLDFCGQ